MIDLDYPRDLAGYRGEPPDPRWPGKARVAVQFALDIEEGGETCVLHGDGASESLLSEVIGAEPRAGVRHMAVESVYEYGSRAGVWRVLDLFRARDVPITLFAVAAAAVHTPWVIDRAQRDGHEIACHGLRWIDYAGVPEAVERTHIAVATKILDRLCGTPPLGWYTGRTSPNTRRLVAEHGGFLYDADDYSDDLPFWSRIVPGHLVVPHTLDATDTRFVTAQGFHTGDQFFAYLRDAFDTLYAEGAERPRMMSIGLHPRIIGRPGRIAGLARFVDHVLAHDRVWLARRIDIARHWRRAHPQPE